MKVLIIPIIIIIYLYVLVRRCNWSQKDIYGRDIKKLLRKHKSRERDCTICLNGDLSKTYKTIADAILDAEPLRADCIVIFNGDKKNKE